MYSCWYILHAFDGATRYTLQCHTPMSYGDVSLPRNSNWFRNMIHPPRTYYKDIWSWSWWSWWSEKGTQISVLSPSAQTFSNRSLPGLYASSELLQTLFQRGPSKVLNFFALEIIQTYLLHTMCQINATFFFKSLTLPGMYHSIFKHRKVLYTSPHPVISSPVPSVHL